VAPHPPGHHGRTALWILLVEVLGKKGSGKRHETEEKGESAAVFMAGGAPLLLTGRPRVAPPRRCWCAEREAGEEKSRVSRASATSGSFITAIRAGGRRIVDS
jgi:hypothetical protein